MYQLTTYQVNIYAMLFILTTGNSLPETTLGTWKTEVC